LVSFDMLYISVMSHRWPVLLAFLAALCCLFTPAGLCSSPHLHGSSILIDYV